jgi:glycosyltransferase involved in cell wall biosynthesis
LDRRKSQMNTITIVIPALNEEKGIGPVIKEIPIRELKEMGYRTEIMVIDNGSRDNTRHIARSHGATVIIQPVRGYGNAYKAGFANATGDIIATGDADLTYPFEDLPKFIKKMEKNNLDFINTNRLKYVNPEVMTPSHIFGNWVLTTIMNILFSAPFVDSQSGMWIFKSSIWQKLDVQSSGMPFSQEIKIEAFIRGFKCAEIPVKYRARAGDSKLNTVRDGFKTISHLFYKKLSLLFSNNSGTVTKQILSK